jgi:hypothetical protein
MSVQFSFKDKILNVLYNKIIYTPLAPLKRGIEEWNCIFNILIVLKIK